MIPDVYTALDALGRSAEPELQSLVARLRLALRSGASSS